MCDATSAANGQSVVGRWITFEAIYDGAKARVLVDGAECLAYDESGDISYPEVGEDGTWLAIGGFKDSTEVYHLPMDLRFVELDGS